ncbi:hypothetical protein MP228_002137 [Amoeboaphelidium protococcarum]|nr:hypothetical protein MP228_002137 [Amoeboaphelidium protococcarum]
MAVRSPNGQNDSYNQLQDGAAEDGRPTSHGESGNITVQSSLKFLLLGSKLNWLVLVLPFGLAAEYAHWSPLATFILNFVAIIPLSKMLGVATEELALRTSAAVGALLNATFGNAIELIISIIALSNNLIRVVQASLLGSILSNILLVLGCCFFFGGLKYKVQSFSNVGAQTSAALLSLTVLSILLPAAFDLSLHEDATNKQKGVLALSRGSSILLIIVYIAYVVFQLRTHSHVYSEVGTSANEAGIASPSGQASPEPASDVHNQSDEEEAEVPHTLFWVALAVLVSITVFVSLAADALVSSIEPITKDFGISETFVSLILIPIVGNAAEHVGAITFALKNKMEIAVGIAVGSSLQIALFVTPLTVIVGWILNKAMTLDFHAFESFSLFGSVLMVNYVIADGQSHYLEGLMLLCSYVIIGIAFWFYP